MRVLVTGANGFVGRWMVRSLLEARHEVVAAVGPAVGSRQSAVGSRQSAVGSRQSAVEGVATVSLDLRDRDSVQRAVSGSFDAVVHLAGEASGAASLGDPGTAWEVNAAGSARVLGELGRLKASGSADPLVLLVSTADVYGAGNGAPVTEDAPAEPRSPYAASKAGAEVAARETALRTGLRVIIARPFPHTGPGQDDRFVVPALAGRLAEAKKRGERAVRTGNLALTRDILDVRDVVAAYGALLERGASGQTYNVASGRGVRLDDVFAMLAKLIGVQAAPATDESLLRPKDAAWLVGDATKLRTATGWSPRFTLEETLRDLVHAQAD